MEFRRFSAGLISYGGGSAEPEPSDIPNVQFSCEKFSSDFAEPHVVNYANIERMLLNLALNHTVLVEKEQGLTGVSE